MKPSNIKKLLFKSVLSFGSVQVLNQLIQFFLLPLYTNKLSKEDYGSIEYVLILNTVFALVFSFQVHQSVMRFLADIKEVNNIKRIISTCFWFVVASFLFFIIILCILHYGLGIEVYFEKKFEYLFLLVLGTLFFTGLNNFFNSILIWSMEAVRSSIITAISIVVNISIAVYLVAVKNYGIDGIIIAGLCAQITIFPILLFSNLKLLALQFSWGVLKENLKFSTPLIFSSLAYYSWFFIDRYMINRFLGKDELGVFSVAVRFAAPIGLVLSVLEGALFPIVLNNYKNQETKTLLAALFNVVAFGFSLFFLFVICFSPIFYDILVDEKFYYGHSICFILCLGQFFSKIYFFNPGFAVEKKTSIFLTITVISSCLNFLLNYLLVNQFGIVGSALATGASAIVYFCLLFIYSNRLYKINFELLPPFLSLMTIVLAYLLVLLSDYKQTIIIFFAAGLVLLLINKSVLVKVRKLMSNKLLKSIKSK